MAFCPRKFTKLLKPVYSHLRQLGHLSASHIDDSYLQGDDYDDCERNVRDTVKLFDSLGFTVHPEKSSFVPQNRITFMGFIIDSITMTVYPTSEKIEKIIHTCQGLLECPQPTVREVASTLGLLISNFPAAKLGPLHFRSIDMDKTEALRLNKGNFDAFMHLSELSRSDLQWWINSARSLHNPISLPQPEVTLYTDASKEGWGGVLDNVKIGGHWTPEEASNHINYLEMLAVLFSLKAFHKELSGKHVLVRIDNMTAVSDLGKMGTSHSKKRNDLTRTLWEWCLDNNMWITTSHIPGKENTLADAESRKSRKETEWTLDKGIFHEATKKIHVEPQIDLFASRLNYQLKPFVAYQPDPEAMAINAFSISWKPYIFYAFLPFSIIPKVLQKIQAEEATGLLVVPCWPTQPWWPLVMRLLVQEPLVLPKKKHTLFLPQQPDVVHPLHQKLTLLICHLSANHFKAEAFQTRLLHSSCSPGERALNNNINHSSPNGNSTVVKRKINPFSATIEHGINFLAELYHTGIGYSALNTARCALSVCVTSEHYTFGQHPLVCRFIKGIFECRPSLPRYQETWDVTVVLDYLAKLGPPEKLSLKNLTLKVVMLMALLSGQRRQTLHTLSIDRMQISSDKCVFFINSLLKTSKPGKHLSCIEFQASLYCKTCSAISEAYSFSSR